MAGSPLIRFINHACFIIDTGPIKILCDPWLTGSVFQDGWDLLVPTGKSIEELEFTSGPALARPSRRLFRAPGLPTELGPPARSRR